MDGVHNSSPLIAGLPLVAIAHQHAQEPLISSEKPWPLETEAAGFLAVAVADQDDCDGAVDGACEASAAAAGVCLVAWLLVVQLV